MQVTDQNLEIAIGRMLQFGVMLAAAVVLLGGILYLRQETGPLPDYHHFHGEVAALRSPATTIVNALHGNAQSIIQFGLLLLIATPIARVVLAATGFGFERDRLYVCISLIVLGVLLFSLLHAV
jgi:uncharacterized membrane protein